MKKVLNWTIGSFFRTIGRTIAFIVMGGLIYYILTYNGVGIKDLFFDNVKASETDFTPAWQGDMWNSSGTKLNFDTFGFKTTYSNSQGSTVGSVQQIFFNSQHNVSGGGLPIPDGYQYATFRLALYNSLAVSTNEDFATSFLFWTQNNWGAGASCEVISDSSITLSGSNDIYKLYVVKCPIINGSTSFSSFNISYLITDSVIYNIQLSGDILFTKRNVSNQQVITAIENQTNQQHSDHQETQEYLEDSNTTEAEEEAQSFFEDFDVPDVGGLSAIITAPLNTIRSLLNSSCTNLTLPLPYVNKNIVLPCMNSIYTEHFGAFFTIYQTIILAIIAYRCIRSIYFDIHGFTNPDDDRIEVMDL